MTMTPYLVVAFAALAGLLKVYFKYRVAALALKDVPAEERAEVLRAIGDAWRGWHSIVLPGPRKAMDDTDESSAARS